MKHVSYRDRHNNHEFWYPAMNDLERYWRKEFDKTALLDIPDWDRSGWWFYDVIVSQQKFMFQQLKNLFRAKLVIADIGCGPGVYCQLLEDMGHQVVGIDYSYNTLVLAKAKFKKEPILFCQGNASGLPLKENFFDVALAMGILQIAQDPAQQIRQLYRILKLNGKVVITTPIQHSLWELPFWPFYCLLTCDGFPNSDTFQLKLVRERFILLPRPCDDPAGIINRYALKKLKKDMINAGFSNIKFRYSGGLPGIPRLTNSFIIHAIGTKK